MKLIYQQGERFRTIFADNEKEDPQSRVGTVIAGRNGEVYFHLSYAETSIGDKGFMCWDHEHGLRFLGVGVGLKGQQVVDLLLAHDGHLWIATQGGLACFNGKTLHTFTPEDGLPSERIRCIFEDSRGHLWVGTDRGVFHYNGKHFRTIRSPHIGPVRQILEDHDGSFWFGTKPGYLVRYRQRQTTPWVRLLQVVTDQVNDEYEEIISSAAGQPVTFEYKGMSFSTHPRDMLYVYRLKEYDIDWHPATREMQVVYRDLQPGEYTFEVRAIDRDLNYSEIAQARLSVETAPTTGTPTSVLISTDGGGRELIGRSEVLKEFQIRLAEVAPTDLTVLILGEMGVGKGLAARKLHAISRQSEGPLAQVNCGAVPESLINSELFGHERGAFTSAVSRRLGKVELADGGTLFLDEIGDMTLTTQTSLLRLLDDGTFERVGSSETLSFRTRIVAATNRNLEEMVNTGDFREDLYYRFQVFSLYLPPLRERKDDIPELAERFKHRVASGKANRSLVAGNRGGVANLRLARQCKGTGALDSESRSHLSGFSN